MKGMLATSTYRQLGKEPTATQESRLSRKLKQLKKGGEITANHTINSGQQAASHPGSMVSPKSTNPRSHSDPLSRA